MRQGQSVSKVSSSLCYRYDTARDGNACRSDACWLGNLEKYLLCGDIGVTAPMPGLTAIAGEQISLRGPGVDKTRDNSKTYQK